MIQYPIFFPFLGHAFALASLALLFGIFALFVTRPPSHSGLTKDMGQNVLLSVTILGLLGGKFIPALWQQSLWHHPLTLLTATPIDWPIAATVGFVTSLWWIRKEHLPWGAVWLYLLDSFILFFGIFSIGSTFYGPIVPWPIGPKLHGLYFFPLPFFTSFLLLVLWFMLHQQWQKQTLNPWRQLLQGLFWLMLTLLLRSLWVPHVIHLGLSPSQWFFAVMGGGLYWLENGFIAWQVP